MAETTPDASLIADDGLVETSAHGLTYPWGKTVPASGETIRIAPGISWARLPMFGSLGHINSWLLDDEGGVAPVDTGLMIDPCSGEWKALFAGALKDTPITRVFCTHMHPDHTGLAGWLTKKFGVQLWMTRGEWLTARMLAGEAPAAQPPEMIAMQIASGWSEAEREAGLANGMARMGKVMFPLPISYHRMMDGDVIHLGPHQWRVVVGSGHSPEHACLWNEREGILVSGDQILPKISSNVSINVMEPDANPLDEWLRSIDRLLELPADLLVCPAHGEPFKGMHIRLRALRDEHHKRLDDLAAALTVPKRAVDCFSLLFNREISDEHRQLASGEAVAHLRYLERTGRAVADMVDGVRWYRAA